MITIIDQPVIITPVYNTHPLYIKVESDKSTEEAFNFIFDLYVNDVFVNRVNLLPRPGTNETLYSPARILESYVSYDLSAVYSNIVNVGENSIVKWSVQCGEEYVFYWPFFDTQINSLDILTRLVNNTGVKHQFIVGDKIIVDTPLYPYFSGIHTIVEIVDEYIVVINKAFITTPTNPGTAVFADKRKTEFFPEELLPDTTFQNVANWTQYGPDGSLNTIENATPGYLNWIQYNSATFLTKYTEAIGVTLTPGLAYDVTYRVYDTFPALGLQKSYVSVGGALGTINSGVGLFTERIVCGFGTEFRIFGSCTASGFQGITFTEASLELAPPTGYSFNGVIQYEKVALYNWNYNYIEYLMQPGVFSLGKFLTNQPKTIKVKLTDTGSIGFLNIESQYVINTLPDRVYYMVITTNNGIFLTSTNIDITTEMTSEDISNKVIELGCYPQNINASYPIIDETILNYSVQLYYAPTIEDELIPLSEIRNFEMETPCSKYEPVRFMFLNSLGQFDYYNATLLSRTTISGTRDTFVKTLGFGYGLGDRGKTVINVNSQESYIIHTDWISEETANWLSYEFFNSTEIYIIADDVLYGGNITPIILDTTSIEVKKRVNDKLLNYTFNYSKAVPLNNQRN